MSGPVVHIPDESCMRLERFHSMLRVQHEAAAEMYPPDRTTSVWPCTGVKPPARSTCTNLPLPPPCSWDNVHQPCRLPRPSIHSHTFKNSQA